MHSRGRNTKRYTFALYLGAMIFCMCINLTGSVLNEIMTDYNIDLSQGGLMTFAQYTGGIVTILILSNVSDRFKKPIVLIVGFAVVSAMLFLIGGFQPFALFMIFYLIYGAALGILDTNNNATLTDLYPDKMDKVLSILHGICGVGAVLMPAVTAIVGTSNWMGIYTGVAVIVAAIVIFQIIMYMADKKDVDSFYVRSSGSDIKAAPSKAVLTDKNIWFATFSMLFFGLSQGGIVTWVVKYNTDMFPQTGPMGWALGLSIYWLGATICRLSMGILPYFQKWDSKKIVIIGGILAGAALLAGIISGNYYVFMACVLLYGILNGATIPRLVGLMNGWYPQNTGLSSSLSFTALYSGFAVAALTMGAIASAFGIEVMMYLPVAATVISGLIAMPISKK